MATLPRNFSLPLRGKVGEFVFKRYGDRLVVTRVPRKSKKPRSAKQRASTGRFREASAYAKRARQDADVWALYEAAAKKRRIPTRAMAIQDYMTSPKPVGVLLAQYQGAAGERLSIVMHDPGAFKTVAIDVEVRDAAGALVAAGPAKRGHRIWHFVVPRALRSDAPLTVEFTARDRFGKSATLVCSGRPGQRKVAC